jgi:hypothetical protein
MTKQDLIITFQSQKNMTIDHNLTEQIGILAALTIATITTTPCNVTEQQRNREQRPEIGDPAIVRTQPEDLLNRSIEEHLRHRIYNGPTISEYRTEDYNREAPAPPDRQKDRRFYGNEAILPQSMRLFTDTAPRRMPDPEPLPRDDRFDQTRTAMLMYAKSGHRR